MFFAVLRWLSRILELNYIVNYFLFDRLDMCTLVILRRPGNAWPLLLAGNRDEMRERPSASPGRHWEDRPGVVAGLDKLGGGSWMGLNDQGVAAVVMNREGTLGPDPNKRSRGELVLRALDYGHASDAAREMAVLPADDYRPFNLFVGDAQDAFWLRNLGAPRSGKIEVFDVDSGLHLLSARELDDDVDPRIRIYLPRFNRAATPDPAHGNWTAWAALLGSRFYPRGLDPRAAMNIDLPSGFGTVSSSLIALPLASNPQPGAKSLWLYAQGAPDKTPFTRVPL